MTKGKPAILRDRKKVHLGVGCENKAGKWVPAIPIPYYCGFKCKCMECGKKFWTTRRYREHYALEHILKLN